MSILHLCDPFGINFYLRRIVLIGSLVIPLSSMILAVEVPGPPLDNHDGTAQEEQEALVDELVSAGIQSNIRKTFRFRVVNQRGQPVPGVAIVGAGEQYTKTPKTAGMFFDTIRIEVVTDARGEAQVGPLNVARCDAQVPQDRLGAQWDQAAGEVFLFDNTKPGGIAINAEHRAEGIDYVFHLRQRESAQPLMHFRHSELSEIPLDGTPVQWTPTHFAWRGATPTTLARADGALKLDEQDFTIRFWHDPTEAPSVANGNYITGEARFDYNEKAAWWMEITCLRGGLLHVPESDTSMQLAPITGYNNRLIIQHDPAKKLAEFKQFIPVWAYWRRTGNPVRYGLICFEPIITALFGKPGLSARLSTKIWLNPQANDPRLERPQSPGLESNWERDGTDEESSAMAKEPIDAGAIPLIEVPALVVPAAP